VNSRVSEQLDYLRMFGMLSCMRFDMAEPSPMDMLEKSSPLIKAYIFYLSAVGLHQNVPRIRGDVSVFWHALVPVRSALNRAVPFCELARPRGIGAVLQRALEYEIALVGSCKRVCLQI
jgi:hypothetical protein